MALLATIVFFALLVSPMAVLYATNRRERRERDRTLARRLGQVLPEPHAASGLKASMQRIARLAAWLSIAPWIGGYVSKSRWPTRAALVIATPGLLAVGTIVFADWLNLPVALFCGVGVASLPLLYLRRTRQQRLKLLDAQLPYLIDLLKSALESGHTMLRALQMAGQNLSEPLSSEMRLIVEQVQLGMSVPLAFEAMYQRAPVEELGFIVAAVRIQAEVGSSLAEIFQHASEGMRNRQRTKDQLRALTAQARLSAVMVTLLPLIVLAIFSLINPAYSHPLFHNQFGIKLLEIAIVLDTIGFFAMRRIAQVNF